MPRRERGRGRPPRRDDDWDEEPPLRRRDQRRSWERQRGRAPAPEPFLLSEILPVPTLSEPPTPVCGNCREWFGEEPGGRGDCAHPGSGFLHPWSDTPACPFFVPRR